MRNIKKLLFLVVFAMNSSVAVGMDGSAANALSSFTRRFSNTIEIDYLNCLRLALNELHENGSDPGFPEKVAARVSQLVRMGLFCEVNETEGFCALVKMVGFFFNAVLDAKLLQSFDTDKIFDDVYTVFACFDWWVSNFKLWPMVSMTHKLYGRVSEIIESVRERCLTLRGLDPLIVYNKSFLDLESMQVKCIESFNGQAGEGNDELVLDILENQVVLDQFIVFGTMNRKDRRKESRRRRRRKRSSV